MPVLDGFGAIRKIRADPAFAGLPVLAATAYAMRGDREKTLEAGFDGYVSKPIQPAALKQEIARLLSMQAGKAASAKAAGAATG
jgi:CheY-like chemotaxis protein